jgi:hypothetical protein
MVDAAFRLRNILKLQRQQTQAEACIYQNSDYDTVAVEQRGILFYFYKNFYVFRKILLAKLKKVGTMI